MISRLGFEPAFAVPSTRLLDWEGCVPAASANAERVMSKGEIGWKGRFDDGRSRQVYARRIRKQWFFFEREKRFEPWRPLERPSLNDWRTLLDAVERRARRRAAAEEEKQLIRQRINELFPAAPLSESQRPG